ncbi:glycosyltransferase involved in cell wall biosynthesis [Microbacterium sp. BE35]|uniref:glycosyltransferase n=1 Tax=Microbacterium sp. BE35 TaxID=2817773 RepID=UPI0028604BEC|nr:glycosyltransferase [Microbacterium sp. BE35]MDR7189094.1 glycosyltransferase involved in cell wall biosynthesis [Microbacterium sp. BE35]
MVATLRVVLDQLVAPSEPELAEASRELARALVLGAPSGCEVEAIAPAGGSDGALDAVPGLAGVRRTALPRRELAAALQLGVGTGIGGGMIHSPSLFAPLVRHDRVHNHDQAVVTVWDLRPWESPSELPRAVVAWHKAMLKRAVKHADALVVPTHSLAARLLEIAPGLRDRVRVIAGAAPLGFAVPTDEVGRRRELGVPEGYVLLAGGPLGSEGMDAGLAAVAAAGLDLPVVVIDVEEGHEPAVADLASAAGLPERALHVRGVLDTSDRAAVFGAAVAFVAPSRRAAFPWRVVDALTLGVPVIAASSAVHDEVVFDGGVLVPAPGGEELAEGLGAALASGLGSTAAAERLGVLAGDRGRAFSWREAADKVWMLHAEL